MDCRFTVHGTCIAENIDREPEDVYEIEGAIESCLEDYIGLKSNIRVSDYEVEE